LSLDWEMERITRVNAQGMFKPRANAVKGWATMARPFVRLLAPVPVVIVALFTSAAMAQAKPPVPALTGTTPPSSQAAPANSTSPHLLGEGEPEEGVITQGLRPPGFHRGLTAAGVTRHPGDEIEIFNGPVCAGSPLVTGSVEALEGSGIVVTVLPNSVTEFSADQIDPAEPGVRSACSAKAIKYYEGVIPPGTESPSGPGPETPTVPIAPIAPAPAEPVSGAGQSPAAPRLLTVPGGTANDSTPLVAGTAPGAATVKIFAGRQCAGAVVAKGTAAQLAAGFPVQVADNSLSAFTAVAMSGGGQSGCSEPVFYVEDSTAPHTRITMGPASKTRKRAAVFRFTDTTGDAPGTAFFCKVDKHRWKPCGSPLRLRHLRPRRYSVAVKAIDPAGNVELKPAKRRFKVIPPL
jgi:hypothetical protein